MSQPNLILTVRRRQSDDTLREVAQVEFGERGLLSLRQADEGLRSALENIVQTVNAQAELRIKTAPPPGAPRGSLYRRNVARTEPDLLEALQAYMEQKYDLVLDAPETSKNVAPAE